MFGFFNFNNNYKADTGFGDANYTDDPLLGNTERLLYKECMDIYKFWPLGKRVASALPNFALSAERNVYFDDLPAEFADEFKKIERIYNITEIVKKASIYTRVFGLSALYVAHSDVKPDKPLTYRDVTKGHLTFNLQDPLNLNGIKVSQDPLSVGYQKVSGITIAGQEVNPNRCCVLFNDLMFYLQYTPSTFTFGPQSVYQNMVGLIRSWNRCVISLERMATKAGSIVYKSRQGGVINSVVVSAARKSLDMMRQMQNDGAASIDRDDSIEFFNLTGVGEVDSIIDKMNQIILMALSDTPAAILLDKELAQGFGNGEEDMKAILMAVDNFRKAVLTPLYDFIDKYLLYILLNPIFLESVKKKYPDDFKSFTIADIREKAIQGFRFEWGNLYPETEATKIDNNSKKLDNLLKMKELGCNLDDIEEIINNDDQLYSETIELTEIKEDLNDSFGSDDDDESDGEEAGGDSGEPKEEQAGEEDKTKDSKDTNKDKAKDNK